MRLENHLEIVLFISGLYCGVGEIKLTNDQPVHDDILMLALTHDQKGYRAGD